MNQVIFITVRICTDSDWLNAKMLQLTQSSQYQLSEGEHPIVIVDNYEQINEYLNQAKWLVVQTAGDIVVNIDHLRNKLHNIPDTVGLIGHLIWYPEDAVPHLHEQCFIINTQAFTKLLFDSDVNNGPGFVRGNGDMNNGHAPLSVHLGSDTIQRNMSFGTKVIEHALTNGYNVVNFDEEWRYPHDRQWINVKDLVEELQFDPKFRVASRGYFYPNIGPELFEDCLKNLTVTKQLEESQQMIISILKKFLSHKYLNMWQWDYNQPHVQADVVISPANGLLGEVMALTSNAKKIIFYDLNPNNINFKKDLYEKWNGIDYEKFALAWAADRNLNIEPELGSAQQMAEKNSGNNKTVLDNWNKIKQLDIEFHCLNFLDNIDLLLENNQHFFLHTSTILNSFIITNIKYSAEEITTARNKIQLLCNTHNGTWIEST